MNCFINGINLCFMKDEIYSGIAKLGHTGACALKLEAMPYQCSCSAKLSMLAVQLSLCIKII